MFQIFSRFDILFIPATTRFPPLVCLKGMHIPKLGQSAISQGMTTVNHNLNYRHGNNELGSQIQAIGTLKDIHDLVAITGQHAPAPPPHSRYWPPYRVTHSSCNLPGIYVWEYLSCEFRVSLKWYYLIIPIKLGFVVSSTLGLFFTLLFWHILHSFIAFQDALMQRLVYNTLQRYSR